jgi:copper transport protein
MRRLLILGLLLGLLLALQPVRAHGYIVRAIPEDRAVLERPPTRLQYWFSEGLEPSFSSVLLRDQTGAVLAEGGTDPDNRALMTLAVPPGLPDGAYLVELRPAFASDGHVRSETRVFFVGAAVGGVAGSASVYEVMPLEVVWRVALYAAALLLLGAAALYAYVLLPAWGNPVYRAGLLPPRVMRRLNTLYGAALLLALAGNIVALLQQSMVFFNTGLDAVIAQGLWQVVRIGSRFGDVWTARMILLALAAVLFGLSIAWRDERPDTVRAFWTANVWVGALLLGTFSITSHAAGSLRLPWVAVLVDWAHVLAVGVWVGGLAALALIMPAALQPYSGEARAQALLAALRRFSRLAVYALAVVVATGIYSALNWLFQPADLTQTGWGLSLLVKVALVGSLLLFGLIHHLAANPERYARLRTRLNRVLASPLTLLGEAVLALAVLVAVAFLSASAVPEPILPSESAAAPQASARVADLNVNVTLSPGGPGINTLDVLLEQNGQSISDVPVRVQIVQPARDWRSGWQALAPVGSGLYVISAADIDREGRWLTLLDIAASPDSVQRAAFAWDIDQAAAVPTAISPGPLNILALVGVLAALAWAAYPFAYRFYKWLDWRPASVAVAVSALVGTVLLIALSIAVINQSSADYEATINPPPQIINPVLPDAASLAQGRALFTAHCAAWETAADLPALIERLPRTRDEALYTAVQEGWRSLPPCSGALSAEQVWHLVNFIRTLS